MEPCTKYEITIKQYLGVESEKDKNDEKKTNKPLFMGETGVSIAAYTSIDPLLPFKLESLKIKEDLSSINLFWSRKELPCIDMINMLKFEICENEDKTSCFKDGENSKNTKNPGSSLVTTAFQGLQACTSYLVSKEYDNMNITRGSFTSPLYNDHILTTIKS